MSYLSAPEGGSQVAEFDFGTRLGMVFIVQAASLSALAVFSLLIYIAYSIVVVKRGATRNWVVSSHIHLYFVNLLVADLIQAIGSILNVQWVMEARVTEGSLCTTQGIFKQMGDVGVALTTLVIALHTFSVLVLRWQIRSFIPVIVLVLIWVFIALAVGISMALHHREDYYGSTGYWCWITGEFGEERIALEYVWMWLTAIVNLVCYLVIALVVTGVLVVDSQGVHFRCNEDRKMQSKAVSSLHSEGARQSKAIAMQMLFYPAVYIITIFPIAVVRWMSFKGSPVPFAATAFASILFSSSGWLNVLLFGFTRPRLLPGRDSNKSSFFRSNSFTPSLASSASSTHTKEEAVLPTLSPHSTHRELPSVPFSSEAPYPV